MRIASAVVLVPRGDWMCLDLGKVTVTYEDGSQEEIFEFFQDEIMFYQHEFVGLTREQAIELKHKKDIEHLRS